MWWKSLKNKKSRPNFWIKWKIIKRKNKRLFRDKIKNSNSASLPKTMKIIFSLSKKELLSNRKTESERKEAYKAMNSELPSLHLKWEKLEKKNKK
jgi:hypothetical protein